MTGLEFVSLGGWCLASHAIKLANLKKASYPFDWIFSNQSLIIDFLKNTEIFSMEHLTLKYEKTHHIKYGAIFNHHSPVTNDNDYQYFRRCVGRFRRLQNNRVCFVIVLGHHESIDELYMELSKTFQSFDLLVFEKTCGCRSITSFAWKENVKVFSIQSNNLWNDNNWDAHKDNDVALIVDALHEWNASK